MTSQRDDVIWPVALATQRGDPLRNTTSLFVAEYFGKIWKLEVQSDSKTDISAFIQSTDVW